MKDSLRPFWQRLPETEWGELCPVVNASDADAEAWRFVTEPIDPHSGTRVRLQLVRGDLSDIVCMKMDHVAADATGTRDCARLLAETYGRLAEDKEYRPSPNLGAERSQEQVFRRIDSDTIADVSRRFRGGGAPAFGWPSSGDDISGHRISYRRLPPQRMTALRSFGRSNDATLNDVLLAAFYRALIALFDPPIGSPLPLQVPIDLRRYLPEGRAAAICNLSGGLFPAIDRHSGEGFPKTLTRVTAAMAGQKADHPGIGSALFMENVFRQPFDQAVAALIGLLAASATSGRSHPYLSNLGTLEWPHADGDLSAPQLFGDAEVKDAFLLGPVLYPPASMVAFSSFVGTLTITMGYPDQAVDGTMAERFLDMLLDELPV